MKAMWMRSVTMGLAACCLGGAMMAQDTTSDDKKFLEESSQGNLFEINLAKLALQKSKDPNVTKFATRMIKDHEMLGANMKPFVTKLGVKPPSGPSLMDKAKYEELKLKSGISFDRAYVEAMVKDHHDDLQKFMDEAQKTQNPELKAAVEKGEGVIKGHTEMIDGIAHMGGIETPKMPNGTT